MPDTCVAGFCYRTAKKNGVSFHLFPAGAKNEERRKQWITFVQRGRKDFDGPSQYSKLCSAHFAEDCYDNTPAMQEKYAGIKRR
jgi:hypothetical protein